MRIFENVLFGHVFQEWILFAYAKQAFPQYNKMEALIESFGDRPMMQTGKPLCQNDHKFYQDLS